MRQLTSRQRNIACLINEHVALFSDEQEDTEALILSVHKIINLFKELTDTTEYEQFEYLKRRNSGLKRLVVMLELMRSGVTNPDFPLQESDLLK